MSDELIIRHCSPTLAGLKTGNLFSCDYSDEEELRADVRRLNNMLLGKGMRVMPLRYSNGRALIYVYRPERLKGDLSNRAAREILDEMGYTGESDERRLACLMQRLRANSDFPHEIGLFLGYPPEDVCGFIRHGSSGCKYTGCWKVYGDADAARKTFASFKKCSEIYYKMWRGGKSVQQLAVA